LAKTFVAPGDGGNAGAQLSDINGKGDCVISPKTKCADPIIGVMVCQHHERSIISRSPQMTNEGEAVSCKRSNINDNDIDRLVAQDRRCLIRSVSVNDKSLVIAGERSREGATFCY